MKHESVKELMPQYLLGDLPPNVTDEIRSHLDECAECRVEAQETKSTLDLLRDALATAQDMGYLLRNVNIGTTTSNGVKNVGLVIKVNPSDVASNMKPMTAPTAASRPDSASSPRI